MHKGLSASHLKFQSTLPRRERRSIAIPHSQYFYDFNPRSREGSDGKNHQDYFQ